MKRIYTILMLSILAVSMKMQAVEVTVNAGTLESAIKDKSVTELKVNGVIDVRDIKFIADEMPAITTLDLSGVKVEAYSSTVSLFAGETTYAADALPAYCFFDKGYKVVNLPASLKYVGEGAFAGCRALQAVAFPAELDSIGAYAYSACDAITEVTLPATLKKADVGAFSRCEALKNVDLSALQYCVLGSDVFANCVALETVKISANLTAVPAGAFACCGALKTVEFAGESRLESIGEDAFMSTSLKEFDFEACPKLKVIGRWAFAGVKLENVEIPLTVESLGEGAFFYNEELRNITLNEKVTEISDFVLAGCNNLSGRVKLSYDATTVGRYAFSDTQLSEVYMGHSLTRIGDRAFENNAAVLEMSIETVEAPALGEAVFEGMDQPNVRLNVVSEAVASYKAAEQWKEFNIVGDLSTIENVINTSNVKVYFTDRVLNVTASETIAVVNVYEAGGVLLASRCSDEMSVSIDMSGMGGSLYIVTVKTVGGKYETFKLIRQ